MSTKIIVTNESALTAKYGAAGLASIQTAINALIAADAVRGLTTVLRKVDDPHLTSTVTKPGDPAQNKGAIDEICSPTPPDYLMILGSKDVIPHQDIRNLCYGRGDRDQFAWSDLPYACPGYYSQDASDFLNPVRVVGRLPDLTGAKVPDYLTDLLAIAAGNYNPLARNLYSSYLGVTAQVWSGSTTLSLTNTFGSATSMKTSPTDGPHWTLPEIAPRSHFFNCHGAPSDPKFYGQNTPTNFPVAHEAAYLSGRITSGTVASCECCYGAELYDPSTPSAAGQMGIANSYLREGAFGYFGSTTIAYGPPTGNGAADLICQYFSQSVLRGASIGRAALEARQNYVRTVTTMTPVDLKTIAQFILLGDPALQPVVDVTADVKFFPKGGVGVAPEPSAKTQARLRNIRRARLTESGWDISENALTTSEAKGLEVPSAIEVEIAKRAAAEGAIDKPEFKSFNVNLPKSDVFMKAVDRGNLTKVVHLATAKIETKHPTLVRVVAYVALENEAGFDLKTFYSR